MIFYYYFIPFCSAMARTKAAPAARRPKAKAKPAAKPRAQKRPRPEDDHDQDMDQDQDEDSSDVESGAGPEQSIGLFGRTSGWQEYPVDKILNVRKKKGQLEYKVAWQGHRRCTWEPTRNLAHAADLAWARSMFLVTGFFYFISFHLKFHSSGPLLSNSSKRPAVKLRPSSLRRAKTSCAPRTPSACCLRSPRHRLYPRCPLCLSLGWMVRRARMQGHKSGE